MAKGQIARAARVAAAAVLLASAIVPVAAAVARGDESMTDLRARMKAIRADLDATSARIERLHARHEELESRLGDLARERRSLDTRIARLQKAAVERADSLYRSGGSGAVAEVLLGAEDFGELQTKLETISQIALDDTTVFVELSATQAELDRLSLELSEHRARLSDVGDGLARESKTLREKLHDVAAEYEDLRARLAAAQSDEEPTESLAPRKQVVITATGGLVCPVAGPVSFVDSYGAPRSGGRSHEGVDMMADYGTPAVAIVPGTITTSAVHALAGNYLVLTGDNGNQYYYAHNQRNVVTSGHVSAGQVIAEVGDTGNATGTPHLHFEYHPGGGSAVNPYPLVASIC